MIATCQVARCQRTVKAKGYCNFHYERKRRGTPLDNPVHRTHSGMSLTERLAAQSEAMENGCVEWRGRLNYGGYGITTVGNRSVKAHRASYELRVGPIPTGLQIDHLCRNPACINPAHLEPVTAAENTRRALNSPTGINARKTHCIRGHEFTAENTRIVSGRRVCRACQKVAA